MLDMALIPLKVFVWQNQVATEGTYRIKFKAKQRILPMDQHLTMKLQLKDKQDGKKDLYLNASHKENLSCQEAKNPNRIPLVLSTPRFLDSQMLVC